MNDKLREHVTFHGIHDISWFLRLLYNRFEENQPNWFDKRTIISLEKNTEIFLRSWKPVARSLGLKSIESYVLSIKSLTTVANDTKLNFRCVISQCLVQQLALKVSLLK